jgi:hypothetical protein
MMKRAIPFSLAAALAAAGAGVQPPEVPKTGGHHQH